MIQHGCIGLAHHQVAIELDLGGVAQLAAPFASASAGAICSKVHSLGIQQRLVERSEVEALAAIFLGAHIAAFAYQLGLGDIA